MTRVTNSNSPLQLVPPSSAVDCKSGHCWQIGFAVSFALASSPGENIPTGQGLAFMLAVGCGGAQALLVDAAEYTPRPGITLQLLIEP
jgi:hypothetical protein